MTGLAYDTDAQLRVCSSLDEALTLHESGAMVWIDLQQDAAAHTPTLANRLNLNEHALEDCLSEEPRPRLDDFEGYAFLLLYGLRGADPAAGIEPRKLGVFLGQRFLITIHSEALISINRLRERCERQPQRNLERGVDYLLYKLLDLVADVYVNETEDLEELVEGLEDASLAPDVQRSILSKAVDARRLILEVRRLALANRDLLGPFVAGEVDEVGEPLLLRFRHIQGRMIKVVEWLFALRERLNTVRENYHATIATQTNDVMRLLTLIATVMLPLSLIAGIYGMNVPLMPHEDDPRAFGYILAAMGSLVVVLLLVFWRKRWL